MIQLAVKDFSRIQIILWQEESFYVNLAGKPWRSSKKRSKWAEKYFRDSDIILCKRVIIESKKKFSPSDSNRDTEGFLAITIQTIKNHILTRNLRKKTFGFNSLNNILYNQ